MKQYLTIEILKSCKRFKIGQVCQVPEMLAKKKIQLGEAKLYELEKIASKTVLANEIIEKKEVINNKKTK